VAFTSVGMGVLGDYVVFFSEELTPTKPPENIHAKWLNSTTINIIWTPLSFYDARGFAVYKVVLTYTDIYSETKQLIAVSNSSFVVFTSLNSGTQYSVAVGVANSGPSSVIMESHSIDGMACAIYDQLYTVLMHVSMHPLYFFTSFIYHFMVNMPRVCKQPVLAA